MVISSGTGSRSRLASDHSCCSGVGSPTSSRSGRAALIAATIRSLSCSEYRPGCPAIASYQPWSQPGDHQPREVARSVSAAASRRCRAPSRRDRRSAPARPCPNSSRSMSSMASRSATPMPASRAAQTTPQPSGCSTSKAFIRSRSPGPHGRDLHVVGVQPRHVQPGAARHRVAQHRQQPGPVEGRDVQAEDPPLDLGAPPLRAPLASGELAGVGPHQLLGPGHTAASLTSTQRLACR